MMEHFMGGKQDLQPSRPQVLRDAKGLVVWSLPENSPEENEVLAISNVQAMFLDRFPEFDRLFPRNETGGIDDEKRTAAAKYILNVVGRSKNFGEVFGGSVRTRRVVPPFEASHVVALRKSFSGWGLKFKMRDFDHARNWRGKSKAEILETAREIFLEEFPEFKELLEEDGRVPLEKHEDARSFVLERISDAADFNRTFGSSLRNIDSSFHGSHVRVLREMFSVFGLTFRIKDFGIPYNFWTNKSEEDVIETCLTLFKEEFPQVSEFFNESSQITDVAGLKYFVLSKVGNQASFVGVFPKVIIDTRKVPYFGNSYKTGLRKIFSPWGLDFESDSQETNILRDKANEYLRKLAGGVIHDN